MNIALNPIFYLLLGATIVGIILVIAVGEAEGFEEFTTETKQKPMCDLWRSQSNTLNDNNNCDDAEFRLETTDSCDYRSASCQSRLANQVS